MLLFPSFKFDFAGRDGGLFTANELIPVPVGNKFRFQVVGQENSTKGTKKPQYITIDTVMVGTAASVKAALSSWIQLLLLHLLHIKVL